MTLTRVPRGAGIVAVMILAAALPAPAHHSFIAEYDSGKPLALHGVVFRVQWMNPHIWIFLDVRDEKGMVTKWQCEGGSPNSLAHHGWSRDTLKAGDRATIEGFPAKDMLNTCLAQSVRLPDGRRLFSSASAGALTSHSPAP
jgi:hypothetical protein